MAKWDASHGRKRAQKVIDNTGPAIDDRVRRSKESVLRATVELLTERGLGGFSVDEVSRRSGVAKTTIYRHWPVRSDLVLDACSQISTEQQVPDTGSFEGDVTAFLMGIADLLSMARWSSVVPSIVDAAEREPELAEIHSRIQLGHTGPLQEIITRAARKGEIPVSTDSSTMIAALLGPLFYRRWFSREPLDEQFVKAVAQNVISRP
jgi:AcrR family transcriptional regulator